MKGPAKNPKIGKSVANDEDEDDRSCPLTGKPYFDLILSKSHVVSNHTGLHLPEKICPKLPPGEVPVVLITNSGKTWDMICTGGSTRRLKNGWQNFVDDKNLRIGDGLVFELIECSTAKIKFKMQILRGDFPSELLSDSDSENSDCDEDGTAENPILII